jgi:hypothetical protein
MQGCKERTPNVSNHSHSNPTDATSAREEEEKRKSTNEFKI